MPYKGYIKEIENFEEIITNLEKERRIKYLSRKFLGSNKKHKWKCLECGNIWFASFWSVTVRKTGCNNFICSLKKFQRTILDKIDLYSYKDILLERRIEIVEEKYKGMDVKHRWKCLICSKIWESTFYHVIKRKHDCPRCKKYKYMGKKNKKWKNNKKKYPKEWDRKLREFIRNRDNRKCQYPNCIYDDTKEKIRLHVHHIDGDKENCNIWNLISLCNKHHTHIENNNPENWIEYFYQYTKSFEL